MSDSLSQEEIDALLNGTQDTSKKPDATIPANSSDPDTKTQLDEKSKIDIIGEVGNITMGQAATTLSSILNHRVTITTPRVTRMPFGKILEGVQAPKVATTVEFKEGLSGTNLMLLEVNDAIIIADLMMGGPGSAEGKEFTDLELSAVAEAMNQMIGSASTSMATMINRKVDILPPNVKLWKEPNNIDYDGIDRAADIYRISFDLKVEGVIDSEIMQIFTADVVDDIAKAMLADGQSETVTPVETQPQSSQQTKPAVSSTVNTATATAKSPTPKPAVTQSTPATTVSQPDFPELATSGTGKGDNLDLILDVPLDLSVVLGKSRKALKDILSLSVGSVVELDTLTDEPLEILVNGKLIATGEVVVINDNFGVRITNIISTKQRITNLH